MAFFTFKKNKLWIWKAYCAATGQLIDWECGNRDTNTLKKLLQRLKKWNVKTYITDNWKSYNEMIPEEMLLQSKKYTHPIERNNFRQRHWFARFRRKTCVVSRFFTNGRFNYDSFCQISLQFYFFFSLIIYLTLSSFFVLKPLKLLRYQILKLLHREIL